MKMEDSMKIIKYPDGTSYVTAEHSSEEIITWKLNSYEDLWHLNQFVDAYNNKYNQKPLIIIPNLIDAQADRRFAKDQSSGLKLVCKFLNSMNANFKIFHPHNPEVVEALMDNVEIIDNSEFIKQVLTNIHYDKHRYKGVLQDTHFDEKISDYLILLSSDAGGFKPLMKLCDKINWQGVVHSCSKNRYYADGKTHLNQICNVTDFDGKDILIIDDILVGGKTFLGIAELLQNKNIGNLYLAVSHITISNPNGDLDKYYKKIFTTNSKNLSYNLKNIEVINIF